MGGLASLMSDFFVLIMKLLKSFSVSVGFVLEAVGTKDSPLLRSITCGLNSCVSDRLTMFCRALWKQSGLRHSSWA